MFYPQTRRFENYFKTFSKNQNMRANNLIIFNVERKQ